MDYLDCEIALPSKPMVVKWKYEDESEDTGYWNGKDFMTYDPNRMLPIISWKPLKQ